MITPNTNSEGRFISVGEHVEWLGCLLSKYFGPKYYAIGNVFSSGGYMETFDLIEQRDESGLDTKYHKINGSDIFIVVNEIPSVGRINIDKLVEGITIFKPHKEFDAVIKISPEKPLKLLSLDLAT